MLKNAIWLFIITVVALMIFLHPFSQMQDLKQKNQDYAKRIDNLREENFRLKKEKALLERDPVYLERVAREKMGLVKEGEMVYKLTPEEAEVEKK